MFSNPYDILIVGAGIAGPALAYALAMKTYNKRMTPLRIALIERSMSKPDRIVAELLQPGGIEALKLLGLQSCLETIDVVPSFGYNVLRGEQSLCATFPGGQEARSFDHGSFVMALRDRASHAPNVDMIEATVTAVIEDQTTQRVIGVRAFQAGRQPEAHFAHLVILADGSFSKFRSTVIGQLPYEPAQQGYFAGLIIKGIQLPIPKYATMVVLKGTGPIILFELPNNEYRMMVELKHPPPPNVKEHIMRIIVPQLPLSLRVPIIHALNTERIRRVPHYYLPPTKQGQNTKPGAFLLGDALSMRHPLTAGGMTVALNDVVLLSNLLVDVEDFSDWDDVSGALRTWHYRRKPLAATINTMSMCWARLFAADGESFDILQEGAFRFFERGPEHVSAAISLAAGITRSPFLLAHCSLALTIYSIWILFTQPRAGEKYAPTIYDYPSLILKAFYVLWTIAVIMAPVMWAEL